MGDGSDPPAFENRSWRQISMNSLDSATVRLSDVTIIILVICYHADHYFFSCRLFLYCSYNMWWLMHSVKILFLNSDCYWQHCAKCNLPVFNLLRGRFWGFLPRRSDTLHRLGVKFGVVQWQGCGTSKIEIFTQIWQKCAILTPRRGVSLVWFSQNLQSLCLISGCVRC